MLALDDDRPAFRDIDAASEVGDAVSRTTWMRWHLYERGCTATFGAHAQDLSKRLTQRSPGAVTMRFLWVWIQNQHMRMRRSFGSMCLKSSMLPHGCTVSGVRTRARMMASADAPAVLRTLTWMATAASEAPMLQHGRRSQSGTRLMQGHGPSGICRPRVRILRDEIPGCAGGACWTLPD